MVDQEARLSRVNAELADVQKEFQQCEGFAQEVRAKGIRVPPVLDRVGMPF